MRRTTGRTAAGSVATACVALGLVAAGAPPAAAQSDPPALPVVSDGCVGPSPVTASERMSWPLARLSPYQAWQLSRGAGVVVAVLDSGVSATATGLTGAVLPGRDVVSGGGARADCLGRGTAMAGIVAGRDRPGGTVFGMAPEATILPIRVINDQRRITGRALADGIDAALTGGADIVVLGTGDLADSRHLRAAVTRATNMDVLVVAPVNDRAPAVAGQPPPAWFPAAYPEVLAIGGVDLDGRATERPAKDGGPDVLAPGVGAVVPGPEGPGVYAVGGPAVAAAYAAGTAALVRAYHPDLTAEQVRDRLLATAERPPGAAVGTVDPYSAVAAIDPEGAARIVRHGVAPVVVPVAVPPDDALARARLVTAAIVTLTLLVAALFAVRHGRRRQRPGPSGH
ncbi:type VII secretion-associated serine protease mycosin [Micromonospora craterilacus]|uniref:Type VII secretion-associated serine protease mycosin n=1 Tax=Micromonospora craterilacus TaxID=1655439 RepID=A0A2W2DWL4_9ACTN|nr:S8 family serine peptidase [Micromonospora craterilacus]PZG14873.1 type VII secretion-associated serine protease mycosin [Micromonospora craterilacus]